MTTKNDSTVAVIADDLQDEEAQVSAEILRRELVAHGLKLSVTDTRQYTISLERENLLNGKVEITQHATQKKLKTDLENCVEKILELANERI